MCGLMRIVQVGGHYIAAKFQYFCVVINYEYPVYQTFHYSPSLSLQDVTEALLLMCNSRLQPPLFARLYNAAKQLSLTTGIGTAMYDKKTHMYHIQQVLEQLPPHRYYFRFLFQSFTFSFSFNHLLSVLCLR